MCSTKEHRVVVRGIICALYSSKFGAVRQMERLRGGVFHPDHDVLGVFREGVRPKWLDPGPCGLDTRKVVDYRLEGSLFFAGKRCLEFGRIYFPYDSSRTPE